MIPIVYYLNFSIILYILNIFDNIFNNTFYNLLSNNKSVFSFIILILILNININFYYVFTENKSIINLNLLNVLVIYHPVILYIYFYTLFKFLTNVYINSNYHKKNFKLLNSYIIITTFILGSYWSSQEIFWNNFWNWDFIEIMLLNITSISIFYIHKKYNFFKNIIFFKSILLYICIFFLISKSSLLVTQHSFSNSFIYSINIYIFIFIFCIYFLSYKIKIFFYTSKVTIIRIIYLLSCVFIFFNYIIFNDIQINYNYIKNIIHFFIFLNIKIIKPYVINFYLLANMELLKIILIIFLIKFFYFKNLLNKKIHYILVILCLFSVYITNSYIFILKKKFIYFKKCLLKINNFFFYKINIQNIINNTGIFVKNLNYYFFYNFFIFFSNINNAKIIYMYIIKVNLIYINLILFTLCI